MTKDTPKPTPNPKKTRSPVEKWIVRGLLIVGLSAILVEARAKYGYEFSVAYLKGASEEEAKLTEVAAKAEEAKEEANFVPSMDTTSQTWGSLQSEPFGALAFIMRGSVGDEIKENMPVVPENEAGESVPLQKDGKDVKLDPESYQKSLHWWSIRDLYSPEPPYQLFVTVTSLKDEGVIVKHHTAGMSEDDLFINQDRMKANPYIKQEDAYKYLGGGGGGTRRGGGGNRGGGGGRGRNARPGGDNEDEGEEKSSGEEGEGEEKTDEDNSGGEEAKGDESSEDEKKEDDGV